MRAFVVFLLCIVPCCLHATTNVAATANFSDVTNAYALCVDGDVVSIPSGDVTWTNGFFFPSAMKRVQFIGAGQEVTIIRRGTNSHSLFVWSNFGSAANLSTQICGMSAMTIDAGAANSTPYMIAMGGAFTQTNRYWRIHHLTITNIYVRGIENFGVNEGVIDHCKFYAPYNGSAQAVTVEGQQRALTDVTNNVLSTNRNIQVGTTTDYVYIEDNVFDFAYDNDAAVELYYDACAVIRYNSFTNTSMGVHENGASRSGAVWEYYMNTQTAYSTGGTVNFLLMRSGYGNVYSNTCTASYSGYDAPFRLLQYRAAGTNVYPAYQTNNIQSYPFGSVTGTNYHDGNSNSITIGYPAFDQPGWGDPMYWSGTNMQFTFHGCYSWGNTANGTNVGFAPKVFGSLTPENSPWLAYDGVSIIPSTSDLVQSDRDYFNNTVRPGYAAAQYPHYLTGITNLGLIAGTSFGSGNGITKISGSGSIKVQ